ncbi:MAG: sugar phosphate isomerase/epimerase family protein [Armatimonadota bacterium]|jgi:sugar phosphate isomerase/epimerase
MMEGYQVGAFARPWLRFSWEQFLSGAAGAGYRYMGFMRHQGHELLPGLSGERIAEIKQSLADHGLTPTTEISLHHSGRCPLHLGTEAAVAEALGQLDVMDAVGVPYYISCGTPEESLRETLFTVLREAAAYGAELGITVTIKSHGGPAGTCHDLVRMVETIDHPNFGIYFDPGNVIYFTGESPLDGIDEVAPHVVGAIVKDETGGERGSVEIEPGTGDVPFEEVFDRLRAGGFTSGPVTVECLGGDDLEEINRLAARVRERVEGWLAG